MDNRKGCIEGKDGMYGRKLDVDGEKERMGMDRRKWMGMDRRIGWGWPLNTPLVRMDKGTIDCDGFIK